jgi:hypothetical protein
MITLKSNQSLWRSETSVVDRGDTEQGELRMEEGRKSGGLSGGSLISVLWRADICV